MRGSVAYPEMIKRVRVINTNRIFSSLLCLTAALFTVRAIAVNIQLMPRNNIIRLFFKGTLVIPQRAVVNGGNFPTPQAYQMVPVGNGVVFVHRPAGTLYVKLCNQIFIAEYVKGAVHGGKIYIYVLIQHFRKKLYGGIGLSAYPL